ncbi:MAG TPA: regulator [Candidatus Hydrogenedentes bacterium]|nr:regulator [Candidatus Hydrogenedentota bacterium]
MLMSLCLGVMAVLGAPEAVVDTPFMQEYHEAFPITAEEQEEANDVRCVLAEGPDQVWAGTKTGLYRLEAGEHKWHGPVAGVSEGPVFDLLCDTSGMVWVAAWDGLYRSDSDGFKKIDLIQAPLGALCVYNGGIAAFGPDGWWEVKGEIITAHELPCARSIRAVMDDGSGGLWIATGVGLTHQHGTGVTLHQVGDEILSADVYGLAKSPEGAVWAAGMGGITVFRDGARAGEFTPKEGLPSVYAKCVVQGPDGRMWAGTAQGVARYDGASWSLRHSRRWLLSDEVRDIVFDGAGTAWIATAKGVSAIRQRRMTLAEKAEYFQDICMKRHVRKPWLVEKCVLPKAGDVSKWEPMDDDNDGQYTEMYLVMESFRYAATKDPDARENARKAYEAMRFLQSVTETSGFIARTVVPTTWNHVHDPNRSYTEPEIAEKRVEEPRYKPVEKRWHHNGEWRWKGDTSSDEITGHFFGYGLYYDLAADEEQKESLKDLVRRVMDYVIDHGYVLVDVDGKHTRWGVWAPERLNDDPDWRIERGVNSVEILSYLKTAWHITGDEKYQREYLRLLNEHNYKENVRHAKTYEVAWCTHIDDELLALAYPGLLLYETDPELRALYRESLDHWYTGASKEQNAFANMIYALLTGNDPNLNDTLFMLRDTPLDLIDWTIDNSTREDIHMQRAPIFEDLQTNRLLPPSERGVIRCDKNPWTAVQGGEGRTEWAPTFWLLPYWMGRHLGFIAPPQ